MQEPNERGFVSGFVGANLAITAMGVADATAMPMTTYMAGFATPGPSAQASNAGWFELHHRYLGGGTKERLVERPT